MRTDNFQESAFQRHRKVSVVPETGVLGTVYAYSPYGEVAVLGPDGGNSLQYTGREKDGTGLYDYRFRQYDPLLNRFISEDPIGLDGGINPYAYVRGDPVSLVDPEGLTDWSLPQGVVDGFAGFGDGVFAAVTLGIGDLQDIRNLAGVDGSIDRSSALYCGSTVAGNTVGAFALGGAVLKGAAKLSKFPALRVLNQNRYLRLGPGSPGPGQAKIPMLRIGPSPQNIQNSAGQYSPLKAWFTHWTL